MKNITKLLPDGRHIAIGELKGTLTFGGEKYEVIVSISDVCPDSDGHFWVNFCGRKVIINFDDNVDTSAIPHYDKMQGIRRTHED